MRSDLASVKRDVETIKFKMTIVDDNARSLNHDVAYMRGRAWSLEWQIAIIFWVSLAGLFFGLVALIALNDVAKERQKEKEKKQQRAASEASIVQEDLQKV